MSTRNISPRTLAENIVFLKKIKFYRGDNTKMEKMICLIIATISLIASTQAQASAIFYWFPGPSVWSLRVAPYIPAGTPPTIVAKGATIIVDPASSTLNAGRITINYNPDELTIDAGNPYGWLGDWGDNPNSLAAPALPDDPNQYVYSDPLMLDLQGANTNLVSSVDTSILGSIVIEFDWLGAGYTSNEPYNFFAINFAFTSDNVALMPVANGTLGAAVSMAASDVIGDDLFDPNYALCDAGTGENFCSTDTLFPDFAIVSVPVPIPAAVWLFGSGLIGLIGIARKKAA